MNTEFDLTMEDNMAYQRYYIRTNKQIGRNRMMSRWMYPAVFSFLLGFDILIGKTIHPNWLWFILVSIPLWIIFTPKWFDRVTENNVRKNLNKPENNRLFGKCSFRFMEEEVVARLNDPELRTKWSNILGWTRTGEYIFLHLSNHSARIVPLMKLSGEQTRAVREELIRHLGKPVEKV